MTSTAERLLDAVDQVIAEHGPSGVTLRRVGDRAGLSHTAAAHYYKDKPGLFTAYITRAWNRVADGVEEAAAIDEDRAALRQAGLSYLRFAIAEPSAFSVMSRVELGRVETDSLWEARERGFLTLAALIDRCQRNGWATGRETLDVLSATWSMVHGFAELWVGSVLAAPYDGQEPEDVLTRLLDQLLDGLDRPPTVDG